MKVLHVNYYDFRGGAGKAVCRLHQGLMDNGIDSRLLVQNKQTDIRNVLPAGLKCRRFYQKISAACGRLQLSQNPMPKSLNIFNSGLDKVINRSDADIVHLHWINGEMISIREIAGINKKIIWTFHDGWPFCGAEHHSKLDGNRRFKNGYTAANKEDRGIDIDRYIWRRKIKFWQNLDVNIVTPSKWLEKCVSESVIFKDKKITTIPNGIDTNYYKPLDKNLSRNFFNLPSNKKIIAFGAANINDKNKGGPELLEIIKYLGDQNTDCEIITIGSGYGHNSLEGIKVNNLGHLTSEDKIIKFYSAADVFILPSKQDNLPNMIMESLACGTPCVGFDIGGIPDMISHKVNGFISQAYSSACFADGINWILNNPEYDILCRNARSTAVNKFDINKVTNKYIELYNQLLSISEKS